ANVLLGTTPAGVLLAVIRSGLNAWGGQIIGQIGMLIAGILIIRILPEGISSYVARWNRLPPTENAKSYKLSTARKHRAPPAGSGSARCWSWLRPLSIRSLRTRTTL